MCTLNLQLLVQFPQLSAGKVLQLVHTHLEPGGGAKAAEERGACFGKGFALLALVSSGILSSEVRLLLVEPPTGPYVSIV